MNFLFSWINGVLLYVEFGVDFHFTSLNKYKANIVANEVRFFVNTLRLTPLETVSNAKKADTCQEHIKQVILRHFPYFLFTKFNGTPSAKNLLKFLCNFFNLNKSKRIQSNRIKCIVAKTTNESHLNCVRLFILLLSLQ